VIKLCLKRIFCKHEFQALSSYKRDVDSSVGYRLMEFYIIYCPKCGKRRDVIKYEYEAIMSRQRIDREYNKNDNERT
jgi:hypothetical protein